MGRQIVFTAKAAKPPATYSQAVKAAGLVFVFGHSPGRSSGSPRCQTACAGSRPEGVDSGRCRGIGLIACGRPNPCCYSCRRSWCGGRSFGTGSKCSSPAELRNPETSAACSAVSTAISTVPLVTMGTARSALRPGLRSARRSGRQGPGMLWRSTPSRLRISARA